VAPALLATADRPCRLIADKAYFTDAVRALPAVRCIEPVIPRVPGPRGPARLTAWLTVGAIATRYDRLARNYLSALALIAVVCFSTT